jgi:hypothetical protein
VTYVNPTMLPAATPSKRPAASAATTVVVLPALTKLKVREPAEEQTKSHHDVQRSDAPTTTINNNTVKFAAGDKGLFHVLSIDAVKGESLPPAQRLGITPVDAHKWALIAQCKTSSYPVVLPLSIRVPDGPPRFASMICIKKSREWCVVDVFED